MITATATLGGSITATAQIASTQTTGCADANYTNSDGSYSGAVASGTTLNIPDISFTDSDGTISSVPSVQNIVATPCVNPSVELGIFSDAGHTTPITEGDFGDTIYLTATPTGTTPTGYQFCVKDSDGTIHLIQDISASDSASWEINLTGTLYIYALATDNDEDWIGMSVEFEANAEDELLDVYTSIILCNSLVHRRLAYLLSLARIRRDADNDIADFTPTNASTPPRINEDSIASNATPSSHDGDTLGVFCASDDGYVATLKNQLLSGGTDLVQSTCGWLDVVD